jgi:hypothetical protein
LFSKASLSLREVFPVALSCKFFTRTSTHITSHVVAQISLPSRSRVVDTITQPSICRRVVARYNHPTKHLSLIEVSRDRMLLVHSATVHTRLESSASIRKLCCVV